MLPEQIIARDSLKQAISGWTEASQNKRGVPKECYMREMIRAIGCLFFFDTLYSVKFVWDYQTDLFGHHDTPDYAADEKTFRKHSTIVINP